MIDWLKTRKENRNLRRELRLADGQVETLNQQIADLKKRRQETVEKLDACRLKLRNERSTNTKLRKQIRDQNGADLLVNALRELGVVPKPEKYDSFAEAERLQRSMNSQAQALANARSTTLGQQNAGVTGLGGLF